MKKDIQNSIQKIIIGSFFCFVLFFCIPTHHASASLTDGLVGHWTFDGKDTTWISSATATVRDLSGNGNTGTTTGMSRTSSPMRGKIGQGLQFDGIDDYVRVPYGSVFNSYPFTASVWFKYKGATFSASPLLNHYVSGSGNGWMMHMYNGKLCAWYFKGLGNYVYDNTSNCTFYVPGYNDGNWHHGVFTVDSSGGSIYVDGDLKNVQTWTGTAGAPTSVVDLGIGVYPSTVDYSSKAGYFNNSIDDVRIYNRVLSATEIAQLYKLGGTKVASSPTKNIVSGTVASTTCTSLNCGLVGYWTFDGKDTTWTGATTGTTRDLSGNGNTGTITNMSRSSSPVKGKVGQGLQFDGVDDYVSIPSSATLIPSTISIAAWVKLETNIGTSWNVVDKGDNSEYRFRVTSTGDVTWLDRGATNGIVTTSAPVKPRTWAYIVVTGDATGLKVFVDGALQASNTTPFGAINTGSSVRIGNDFGVSDQPFKGSIDDVRIYNRALSATEIAQLYKLGGAKVASSPTKNIVSGTVASTTCTSLNCGLVGYWTFDGKDTTWTTAATGTVRDLSGNGYSGTTTGMNRTSSPVRGKIGQGLKFDGIDDYVNISYTDLYTSARYKGTVCAWFRPSKAYNSGAIDWIINRSGISGSEFQMGHYNNNNIYFGFFVDGRYFIAANASNWKQNTWQQYCTVWDSAANKIYAYFDGNLLGSTTGFSGISGSTKILIGVQENTPNNYFTGSIDDVRVYGRALSAAEVRQLYSLGQVRRK